METYNKVVNTDELTPHSTTEDGGKEEANQPFQAGDKTPPNQLLEAARIEREKKRILEEKKKKLEEKIKKEESSTSTEYEQDEELSSEGKIFKKEISEVKSEVEQIKNLAERKRVFETYPILKEKEAEFDEYRELTENLGMSLLTAAKAFL